MIILILVFLIQSEGYITFDTNVFKGFDYDFSSTFNCYANTQESTINFSGNFAIVPQIILTFDKIDFDRPPHFQLSITSVTISSFSIKLQCFFNRVYRYQIRWFAIDDSKIEIINCFNQIPTLTKTIPHSNPKTLFGFVSITSFQTIQNTNCILSISSITATSVTINLSSLTNINTIGYQIILGQDESFGSYTIKSVTSPYTSPTIKLENNKFFLLPACGFNFANYDNTRIMKLFTVSGDNLQYTVTYWHGIFVPGYYLEIQIPYGYITLSKAFKASHLQISSYEDFTQTLISNFQIKISGINQIYENIGTYQVDLDDNINTVNIDFLIKCSKNIQITAKLNYCGLCSNQGRFELQRNCYEPINRYNFRSRFQIQIQARKIFTITISQSSFQITQLVCEKSVIREQILLNIIQIQLKYS